MMSKSLISIFAIILPVISILYYQYFVKKDVDTTKLVGKSNISEIFQIIEEIRYDLDQDHSNKRPYRYDHQYFKNVSEVSWLNDDSIRKIIENQEPVVLPDSPAISWKALEWDMWNISKEYLLLSDTLFINEGSVIMMQYVEDDGVLAADESNSFYSKHSTNMFFSNFLYSSKYPSIKMLHSTNYKVFESLTKVFIVHLILVCCHPFPEKP
jgi:hypothetical protein